MGKLISLGMLFDKSIEHYKTHLKDLAALGLWVVVAAVPSLVATLIDPPTGLNVTPTAINYIASGLNFVGSLAVFIATIWMTIALTLMIRDQAIGKTANAKAISAAAWKLFGSYIWVLVIATAITLGLLLFFVPGIVLLIFGSVTDSSTAITLAGLAITLVGAIVSLFVILRICIELNFAPFALILDGKRGIAAYKSVFPLVKGRWSAVFLRFILPKVVYGIIVAVLSFVLVGAFTLLSILAGSMGPLALQIGSVLVLLSQLVIGILYTPLILITDYYLYDSLRSSR